MRSVHGLCLEVLGARGVEVTAQLSFATVDDVRQRAVKIVKAAETLDFKTLMPTPGGLFDYKVFGPGTVIDAVAVADEEVMKPPKTQFARITLGLPIVHPLIAAHAADELVERAGVTRDALEWNGHTTPGQYGSLVDALELAGQGALVMRELAVLPPDLRPLRRLDDDRWAVSPLNEAYRRVIYRNERLVKLIDQNAPEPIMAVERRGLHEALLHLFEGDDALLAVCGGHDSFVATLQELDRASDTQLTARRYRAECVLFALGFVMRRADRKTRDLS